MIATPEVQRAWATLRGELPAALAPIGSDEQLARATADLETLLGEIGEQPEHPLADLARLLIERVTRYEEQHHPIPTATPAQMLAFYMEQRGLTQAQLAAATSLAQPMISRFLSGTRSMTAKHARLFGQYFGVEPGLFI